MHATGDDMPNDPVGSADHSGSPTEICSFAVVSIRKG